MIQYDLGDLMKEVIEFLDKLNINENDNLVVGVSYGPDSMALLDILKKKFTSCSIICAHVHHNHRKESDIEKEKLKEYCLNNNIIFEYMKIDSYINNKFTEDEARKRRYNFFDKILQKYNSNYLFTAHHGDDLVETILMRLVRGSSLKGYCAIPLISKRNNYKLVRPLLYLTKNDILNYCKYNKISYAVDKSNLDDRYTRNRYRNHVLPVLKSENKYVHKQFLKFSTALQENEDFLNRITCESYERIVSDGFIDIDLLLKEDDLIIKRIIMKYLSDYYKEYINLLNNNHIALILNLIKSSKRNDRLSLPGKINLIKSYNKLYFDKENSYNSYCFVLEEKIKLPNGYVIKKINDLENTTNYVTALNKKDIDFPLIVRSKQDGDKMEILGMNGTKKIKDIFIDAKIDITKRKTYPVLTDNSGKILWVPGIKKSKYDKSKNGNYDIILKYQKEEL